MKPHLWFVLGAWMAALGVVNGAFAAHGLRDHLPARYMSLPFDDPDMDLGSLLEKRYGDYDTGVRYHMYHSIGLMLLGLVATRKSSESLMMMVTPRIIIQSEEEEAIGISPTP